MARLVGRDMELKIIEINRERNRLILSERQAAQEAREVRKDELLSTLREGQIHTGTVSSICDFGAFVDIGGADGLIHLSELSWGRVKHPGDVLNVGDGVQVYLLNIDNERKRIALSLKRTQREPWSTLNERYALGQVVQATVTQLVPFGAFARIEDGIEGLIHISEFGDEHVQHPQHVLQEGDSVAVRIIRIDPTRKRMGLSLRTQVDADPPDAEEAAPTTEAESPPDAEEAAPTTEAESPPDAEAPE
jgi:small subunit ribosomal protein S1